MKYKQGIVLFLAAALALILTSCDSAKINKEAIAANKEGTSAEMQTEAERAKQRDGASFEELIKENDAVDSNTSVENSLNDNNTLAVDNLHDNSNNDLASNSSNMQMTESLVAQPLVLQSEDWGLNFGEEGSQPRGNADAADLKAYNAYFVGDSSEKVIYLTFDCGYENGNTEPILNALKKHQVPATFFVVGHFLETAPDLVKRMVEEGHAVGNHTYHHLDMPSISTLEAFQKEIDDVANLFHEITGNDLSLYYRAPQGKCNEANLRMAQQLGYATIFWSLAYVDWDTENQPSHTDALDKLTKRIHPGAVVLLHNTSKTNGEILDELLTKWEEMGYTFRPISDLCGI